jgi:hypothetical protein
LKTVSSVIDTHHSPRGVHTPLSEVGGDLAQLRRVKNWSVLADPIRADGAATAEPHGTLTEAF